MTILEELKEDLEDVKNENIELNEKYCKYKRNTIAQFGMEKIPLSKTHILEAINDPYKQIPNLIKSYHFNPDQPEYNNIKIKNPKDLYYEIYNGIEWRYELKKTIIQTLLQTYKDALDTVYYKKKDKIDPEKSSAYKEFTENIDTHITDIRQYSYSQNSIYKKVYQLISGMIINEFRKKIL